MSMIEDEAAVLLQIREGQVLCRGAHRGRAAFWLEPCGAPVHAAIAKRIAKAPEIKPGDDVLVDGVVAQTYRWRV